MLRKIRFISTLLCLTAVYSTATAQGPIITVHKDEKPPYVSPFDKPTQSESSQAARAGVQAKNAVATNIQPSPVEAKGSRYSADDGQEAEFKPKKKKRRRHSAIQDEEESTEERVVTTPIREPRIEPIRQYGEPKEEVQAVAPIRPVPVENVPVARLVPKHIEATTATQATVETPMITPQSSAVARTPVEVKPVKPTEPVISKKIEAITNYDYGQWLTPMSKMLIGGMFFVILIMGYAIKVAVFKKDPAYTDPWFKPPK